MQGQPVQWDVTLIYRQHSSLAMLIIFYFLAVFLVICRKLFVVWRVVRPFPPQPPENEVKYKSLLRHSFQSLGRWIQLSFLLWGIYVCLQGGQIARNSILEPSMHQFILCPVQEVFAISDLMLVVVIFAFLARWHIAKRAESVTNLHSRSDSNQPK
jgi:hypothetical protein